jgi:thiamine transport system substrate-binding protein
MKQLKFLTIYCLIAILLGFTAPALHAGKAEVTSLTLMCHDSFNASKTVIEAFEARHKVKLRFLKSGDTGTALNQAILSKNNPMADVFFGVDNTFLSRALKADIFIPYRSPLLDKIPAELKLDPQNRLLPVDYGDVCLNYDKKWFAENKIAPPSDLDDIVDPRYKGLTVVENPATSSPGLAFLLATIGRYGEEGFLDYWRELHRNDVMITDGWETAYWGQFSAASEGNRPIVVSYASSPPAEVHYAEEKLSEAPTAAVMGKHNAFRQIEFIGILKGTKQRALAEKLIDFLLDKSFQEDIPLQMFVFPVNPEARLPDVFVKHARIADQPVYLPPETIAAKREQWIQAWTETVLR